jgi:endonuclease G
MKQFKVLSLLVAVLLLTACSDNGDDSDSSGNANANISLYSSLEFPKVKGDKSEVITHSTTQNGVNYVTYSFEWDHQLKAQRWTCYYFTAKNKEKNWNRNNWGSDPFQPDPKIPASEQPSVTGEFSGSSFPEKGFSYFQRGHICPSEDRMASKDANEQTFYMTNMMPQGDLFNGKLWAAMEAFVRNWGKKCTGTDTLFVVKGGTIDKESQILCRTRNGFIVPRYFFMALLSKRNGIYQAMGFWVEHINSDHSSDPLINYACNIRTLEEKTGIDFFCNLPDDVESTVETQNMTVIKRLWNL